MIVDVGRKRARRERDPRWGFRIEVRAWEPPREQRDQVADDEAEHDEVEDEAADRKEEEKKLVPHGGAGWQASLRAWVEENAPGEPH